MPRLFDEDPKTTWPGMPDEPSDTKTNFRITTPESLYPQNNHLVPDGAGNTWPKAPSDGNNPYNDPFNAMKQTDRTNPGFTFYPQKQDAFYPGIRFDDPPPDPSQPDNQTGRTWGDKDWTSTHIDNADTPDPGHNAVVKTYRKMDDYHKEQQLQNRAEKIGSLLELKPAQSHTDNKTFKNLESSRPPSSGQSFRAAEIAMEKMEKENRQIRNTRQIADILRQDAAGEAEDESRATGPARYQNDMHTAYNEGMISSDAIRQVAEVMDTTPGWVINQLLLHAMAGVYDMPPVQVADIIPHTANRVSRSFGKGNVVGTFSGVRDELLKQGGRIMQDDYPFKNPDGSNTAAGNAMEIGNMAARLAPSAALALLMGGQGMSPGRVSTAFLAGDVTGAYNSAEEKTMRRYDALPFHLLMQDERFSSRYGLYSQYMPQAKAVAEAKKEAAKSRASDEAGAQIMLNLLSQKIDKIVPEERDSAIREFFKFISKEGLIQKAGEYVRRAMEMGPLIDQGNPGR